jgi:hypothetical protein
MPELKTAAVHPRFSDLASFAEVLGQKGYAAARYCDAGLKLPLPTRLAPCCHPTRGFLCLSLAGCRIRTTRRLAIADALEGAGR